MLFKIFNVKSTWLLFNRILCIAILFGDRPKNQNTRKNYLYLHKKYIHIISNKKLSDSYVLCFYILVRRLIAPKFILSLSLNNSFIIANKFSILYFSSTFLIARGCRCPFCLFPTSDP